MSSKRISMEQKIEKIIERHSMSISKYYNTPDCEEWDFIYMLSITHNLQDIGSNKEWKSIKRLIDNFYNKIKNK